MIYTNIKTTFLLTFCLFASLHISAQKSKNLPPKQKEKHKRSDWTHASRAILKDGSSILGRVIYPTDSGIVWRTIPQHFPYADTNIHLLPYRDISQLQINRKPRLGRHIENGAMVGGVIFASTSFIGADLFYNKNPKTWVAQSSIGAILGMGIGLLTGVFIDKIRKQQVVYQPNAKNIWKGTIAGDLLYRQKKKGFWRKNWIVDDSLIKAYPLPPELDKLKPYNPKRRLQITGIIGMASESVEPYFQIENGNAEVYDYGYYVSPQFLEIRAAYQLKPWLKVGAFTHKKQTGFRYMRYDHANSDIQDFSDGIYAISYKRSFAAFVEYTPFPVTYMTIRRWEFNLGAGAIRESGNIKQDFRFDYSIFRSFPLPNSFKEHVLNQSEFAKFGATTYLGLSIHLSRNISLETQAGYYFFRNQEIESFAINIVAPYKDIIFHPYEVKLSRSYISLGASLRL